MNRGEFEALISDIVAPDNANQQVLASAWVSIGVAAATLYRTLTDLGLPEPMVGHVVTQVCLEPLRRT